MTAKKTPVKKTSAKKSTKKTEAPTSNKATIFVAWKNDGKPDTDETLLAKYLKLVKRAVQERTVKGWLGEWRRGTNFPKGHKA